MSLGKFFNFAYALNLIMQSAVSFMTPVALFVGGAWLLCRYAACGRWVYIPAILIGVASGVFSMFKFVILATKNMPKAKENSNSEKDL